MSIPQIRALNAARWAKCEITPSRLHEVNKVATRLVEPKAKARYQLISQAVWKTPDRYWFVAITHEREASQDWNSQLGQGDPLDKISRHIPKGRGPFFNHPTDPPGEDAFYRAAVDALTNCPPYAARWLDWTAPGALTLFILYNGTGYEQYHNEASPYDWGATNQEQRGKYTGDGHYSAQVWDTQIGCAAMLKAMMELDPSIKFEEVA